MYFITHGKFKKKPTKALEAELQGIMAVDAKEGIKFHGIYWTLGRYDAVAVFEASSEQAAMKMALRRADLMDTETLVAVPLAEVQKLVD